MAQAVYLPHPSTSFDFDSAYQLPFTFWGDTRIPGELKLLTARENPKTALELGCGLGRFSNYLSARGVKTTGVDFSSVAIAKANQRVENEFRKPNFLVGDVTNLKKLSQPFDVSFDVGCFHCLNKEDQQKYVAEVHRLLKPGATHLIWAMDSSPSGIKLSPEYISKIFKNGFKLSNAEFSRRRLVASHWYWLTRDGSSKNALYFTS